LVRRLFRRERKNSRILYLDHIEGAGVKLFERICSNDMEGIVAKRRDSIYRESRRLPWVKIKNREYTQAVGRHEFFERARLK
jgi:ATP-dependent DNA ligase